MNITGSTAILVQPMATNLFWLGMNLHTINLVRHESPHYKSPQGVIQPPKRLKNFGMTIRISEQVESYKNSG